VGCHPEAFAVSITGPVQSGFARNDLEFTQESEDLSPYGEGLRAALYNYMNGDGFQVPLKRWFAFKTSPPRVPSRLIRNILETPEELQLDEHSRLVWVEALPEISPEGLIFRGNDYQEEMTLSPSESKFIRSLLNRCLPDSEPFTLASLDLLVQQYGLNGDEWLESPEFMELMEYGLLVL
jgi:hypothetical protein